MKLLRLLFVAAISLVCLPSYAAESKEDADFQKVTEEYIKGWLGAHPISATSLGFHEYDGRINDFTRLSIDAELSRLRRFDERLKRFDQAKLNTRNALEVRVLQAAIRRDLFNLVEMGAFERNPMTYAQALDVSPYIKRNFSPLEDRASQHHHDRESGAEHHYRRQD